VVEAEIVAAGLWRHQVPIQSIEGLHRQTGSLVRDVATIDALIAELQKLKRKATGGR